MAGPPGAGADNVDPTQWPAVPGLDPSIETTAHSIRFAGPDRYQTNLALNLALRGAGDFPFDTPDPTSGGAAGLAQADDWWGAATCPRSILVVAGDTFADALAAASLSDPTDQSSQPRLQRVAAADPLFDPLGGFDRPDTAFAPIVVTGSARGGATGLAQTARTTADDLASGGCTTAREAVIVGGPTAVPLAVESELVELGYREVFRVSGADRFDTAARVATALGTGTPPPAGTPCLDPDSTDGDTRMGWYGNAVAEFRIDRLSCQLLPRAVVLADGDTGADALAAGWWTSHWQVPVLLTDADGSLPPATRTALQTLDVDSIVILGGPDRIPESTVDEAKTLATAVAGRIAGPDRYATRVEMAKRFGGWHRTGDGADFENDMVCLAASSGSGPAATGWPDALASGPWCARVGGAAAAPGAPERALPPIENSDAALRTAGGRPPSHDAVPVLLTAPGQPLPPSVRALLGDGFTETSTWCVADHEEGEPCLNPGFATIFGGGSTVSRETEIEAAHLVSGGSYQDLGDLAPALENGFSTTLGMAPVFSVVGPDEVQQACYLRGAARSVRWLSVADPSRRRPTVGVELAPAGVYRADADGVTRTAALSAPFCGRFDGTAGVVDIAGVSVSGHRSDGLIFDHSTERRLTLSEAIDQPAERGGAPDAVSWSSGPFPQGGVHLRVGRTERLVTGARISAQLLEPVGGDEDRMTFAAQVRLSADGQQYDADASGEAVLVEGTWELRGRVTTTIPGGTQFVGGLTATFAPTTEGPTTEGTTRVVWRLDGLR